MDADEREYYGLAGTILHHQYTFDLRRPPVHVLLISAFRFLSGDNIIGTRALAAVFFGLSGPLMYVLARRFTGNARFALAVGLATILWPPFVYYGSSFYSESTALPLFILALITLPMGSLIARGAPARWGAACVAGILLGICILVRPMYMLFTPFAAATLFLEESDWATAARRLALVALGCFVVIMPWSTYMTLVAGVPILVSANGGETLAGGLNPVLLRDGYQSVIAPGGRRTWSGPGKWLEESKTGYLTEDEQNLSYLQRDALLRRRTTAWALENPGSATRIEVAKLWYMWGFYPFWNGTKQTLFGNIPTIAILGTSLISLIRFRVDIRHLSRFWMLPLFVSCVALVSWGSWRFRQPGDLGLIMLSGLFIWSMLKRSVLWSARFLSFRQFLSRPLQ